MPLTFPQYVPKTNVLGPRDIRQDSENPILPTKILRSLNDELQGIQKTNKIISHQRRSQNILLMLSRVFRLDQPGILRRWWFQFWVSVVLLGVNTSVSPGPALNSRALDKEVNIDNIGELLPLLLRGEEKKPLHSQLSARVFYSGWWDGSVGESTGYASLMTWVRIPRTHIKS